MEQDSTRAELVRAAARAYEAAHGNPIPEPARGARWRVQPRVAVSAIIVLATIAAFAAFAARPQSGAIEFPATQTAGAFAPAMVTVHVAGQVVSPGVYQLEAGTRVADAVAAAGGALPGAGTESINLARVLADGEQVLIGEAGGAGGGDGRININTADEAALDSLPGIGPALAARIVADRAANGPFGVIADLERVPGIGEAVVAGVSEIATV